MDENAVTQFTKLFHFDTEKAVQNDGRNTRELDESFEKHIAQIILEVQEFFDNAEDD